ncbi:hypothetical protein [Nocardioides alcanivorans]|uniref:hypothetical protein n=1 Tax=Nocardioides alcanivorans TaxID=2897352 RepID=UPI001F34B617|nr:hypothetical protein [Nocardioides alcanivorans]
MSSAGHSPRAPIDPWKQRERAVAARAVSDAMVGDKVRELAWIVEDAIPPPKERRNGRSSAA